MAIALTDLIHPDRYHGDTHLAQECRDWMHATPRPSLGRLLVLGFLLNKGMVFMSHSQTDSDVAWGSLIESRQLSAGPGVEVGCALDSDLSSFEEELHALALQ